ncbi:hypothetical protein ACVDFE_35730 [Lentzea chajnantorensis]
MSTSHLVEGDVRGVVDCGMRALMMSALVDSARVRDRFRPLASLVRRHEDYAGAWGLADHIDAGHGTSRAS